MPLQQRSSGGPWRTDGLTAVVHAVRMALLQYPIHAYEFLLWVTWHWCERERRQEGGDGLFGQEGQEVFIIYGDFLIRFQV